MPLPILAVNEGSSSYLTVEFINKHGVAEVPISVSYKVDCRETLAVMKAPTTVSPATSVEIMLGPAVNAINDTTNQTEHRVVTVTATYAVDGENVATDAVVDEYEYEVVNLQFKA